MEFFFKFMFFYLQCKYFRCSFDKDRQLVSSGWQEGLMCPELQMETNRCFKQLPSQYTKSTRKKESKPVIKLSIKGRLKLSLSGMRLNRGIRDCSGDLLKDVAAKTT